MRISEIYASTQGEGPNVGKTTVFCRFGGCNLRCPGWPCDSQHAIDPKYRNEWEKLSPAEVADRVTYTAQQSGAKIVTLTGGEPFLQKESELNELVWLLATGGFEIDCFSNGTIKYSDWAIDNISFIMDWKLPGSGEDPLNQMRIKNLNALNTSPVQQAVKFVIKDGADFQSAWSLWEHYINITQLDIETYYGRVWGCDMTDADLVRTVMTHKLPWRLNVQQHNYIWAPHERGR